MTRGIWQVTDHHPVTVQEARREWALVTHDILEEVARRYGRSVQYADLAHEMQRRTGIATDLDLTDWVDDVFADVAERCRDSGEPRLISLIDRPGVAQTAEVPAARMECYQAYGARIPAARSTRRASSRTRAAGAAAAPPARKPAKAQERVRPICQRCFVELPSTGVCDNCD